LYNHLVHKTVLLQTLISLLSEEGIDINPSAAFNIEKVLLNTDLDVFNTFSKLKFRIVPILSRNKEEQEVLYKIFDTLDEKLKSKWNDIQLSDQKEQEGILSPKEATKEKWQDKLRKKIKMPWLLSGVALLTGVIIIIVYIISKNGNPIPSPLPEIVADKTAVAVGDTVHFTVHLPDSARNRATNIQWIFPDTNIVIQKPTVSKVFNQSGDYLIKAVTKENNSQTADTANYSLSVLNEPTPSVIINRVASNSSNGHLSVRKSNYIPQFTNPSKDSANYRYKWYLNDQVISTSKILSFTSKTIGNNKIKLVVDCKGIHYSKDSLVYTINELPPLGVAITGDRQLSINTTFNWRIIDKALFWFLLIIIVPAIIINRLLKPAHKNKTEEPPAELEEPYSIQFNSQDHAINSQKEIKQLADILRKRQVSDIYKLNIRKTIQSSIRGGGLPSLAFAPLSKPSDYLILLETKDDHSHLERVFKYLIAKLESEQVNLVVYEYRKEPLFLNNDRLNHIRIPIDRLAALYPERTLLIFGNTKNFVFPLKNTLKTWVTEKLYSWDTKIIITPLPKNDWDRKEQMLIEANFTVIPADMNANTIIEKIINGTITNQSEAAFQIPLTYSTLLYNFQELGSLKEYLGNEYLLQWICSLAVYPTVDWNLTIAIGRKLESEFASNGKQVDLVNYSHLLKIGRISWLQDGNVTNALRVDMLGYLNNKTELLARQTLVELLSELEDKVSTSSLIKREFDVHKTINKFLIDAYENKNPSPKEEAFIKEILANNQLDQANEVYLNSKTDTLLKSPFRKTKSVNLNEYFKASDLRRKLMVLTGVLLLVILFAVILTVRTGNEQWKKIAPSDLTFVVNKGNTAIDNLTATLVTQDTTISISLDQDSMFKAQLRVQDTTQKSLLSIGTSDGQLLTQDSFKLNSKLYTVHLTETLPIPVNIFYKNDSDLAIANAVEEALPTRFDVTIGQQNFSDTTLRIAYASEQQKGDAEFLQTIANNILRKPPVLLQTNYSAIKSKNNRDTVFEPLPITLYISGKEIKSLDSNFKGGINWAELRKQNALLFSTTNYKAGYKVSDNKLILYILSLNSYPGIQFDVNQNKIIDSGLDREYGIISGTTDKICTQYLLNTTASTGCGAAVSKATLTKTNDEYTFTIPLYEVVASNNAVSASLRFSFYNKKTGSIRYPAGANNNDLTQTFTIQVGRVKMKNDTSNNSIVQYNVFTGLTQELRTEYQKLYNQCVPSKEKLPEINGIIDVIVTNKSTYKLVSDSTGIPWYIIGIIHTEEGSLNFHTHLLNGDPLTARTVHDPAGRPIKGYPPFTWEESAIDALKFYNFVPLLDTSIPGLLFAFESLNGFGNRAHGINSPYLWAGSNNYTKGKFVADGTFDPNAVYNLIGAGVLLKVMDEKGLLTDKKSAAKSAY
jgi:lysozyme family protein